MMTKVKLGVARARSQITWDKGKSGTQQQARTRVRIIIINKRRKCIHFITAHRYTTVVKTSILNPRLLTTLLFVKMLKKMTRAVLREGTGGRVYIYIYIYILFDLSTYIAQIFIVFNYFHVFLQDLFTTESLHYIACEFKYTYVGICELD
ncbi:hypothetical protein PHJA_002675900 [Phtheirospermum japonicum]|uniref:Uncharacterized protein n=1 Tax=Phtheirospermum japonicum TaxID=374723 RepID=A0A830CXQ8_9LAMI|nr:hypothetical protein PHJA_002675900 [Phtheirospermum japonicum]